MSQRPVSADTLLQRQQPMCSIARHPIVCSADRDKGCESRPGWFDVRSKWRGAELLARWDLCILAGVRRGCEMESMGSSSADEGSDGPRFGMMTRACWLMTPRCARADDRRPIQQGRCWRSRQPTTVRRTLRIDKEVVFQCSLFCGMHRAVAQRRSGEQGTTSTRPGLPSVHGGA